MQGIQEPVVAKPSSKPCSKGAMGSSAAAVVSEEWREAEEDVLMTDIAAEMDARLAEASDD